jgi:hypothetical protein
MRYYSRGAPQWRPLECPSRVMGNYHARFLGGKGAERPLTYPELFAKRDHKGVIKLRVSINLTN